MSPRESDRIYQIAVFLHGVFLTLFIIIILNFKFPCFMTKSLSSTDWVLTTTVESIATSLGYSQKCLIAAVGMVLKIRSICQSYIQNWVHKLVIKAVKVLRSWIQSMETMVPDHQNSEPYQDSETATTIPEPDQFYETITAPEPQNHTLELPTLGTRPEAELHTICMRQKAPFRLKMTVSRVLSGAIQFRHQETCVFCNIQPETREHIFFRCIVVKPIWTEFWGLDTGCLMKRSWSMANWVEAILIYPRTIVSLDGMDVDGGQLFLFTACLVEKVLLERACIMAEGRTGAFEYRLKYDVESSFETFRRAYGVGSVRTVS